MSLQCAISGEPLTADNVDGIVVTPSGHMCLKRLILAKLAENGGVDPFSDSGRPLSEDDLVPLQASKNRPNMPPPPSTVSSFSGTLQQLAQEYDSVVLELFDTRKTLQDTRRELSQALYQNDAAIRVLARVSIERDTARQEAQQFQAAAQAASVNGNSDAQAPSKKKPRLDENTDLPLSDDIPTNDLDMMLGEWEKLSKARKTKSKSTYTLPADWKVVNSKSWHKSTCRGLTAICQSQKWLVTAGKDKQIMVYDSEGEAVSATFAPKVVVKSLDVMPKDGSAGDSGLLIFAACGKDIRAYDTTDPDKESITNLGDTIVSVTKHPTGKHCCAVTKGGKMMIFRLENGDVQQMKQISSFTAAEEGTEYSCGAMHPDGLLFAIGSTDGTVHVWDLKGRVLGMTFPVEEKDAAVAVAFSPNGYHTATAHASGAVRIWDMRKKKMLAELNVSGDSLLKSVDSLVFHPDGKYLAYGGKGGLHIATVKDKKVSSELVVKAANGIVWNDEWIASIGATERSVSFHAGE